MNDPNPTPDKDDGPLIPPPPPPHPKDDPKDPADDDVK